MHKQKSRQNTITMWGAMAAILIILRIAKAHDTYCSYPRENYNKLLLLMIDGFRWNYLEKVDGENGLKKFVREGVTADYVEPIFPSNSYPSWTTITTGLYPEWHGILDNYMYVKETDKTFTLGKNNTADSYWWNVEQLWTTATKAGRRTAVYDWSMCQVPFDNVLPEFCDPVDLTDEESSVEHFQQVLDSSLQRLQEGFDLVMGYWSKVDSGGHYKGPETEELRKTLNDLDKMIERLLQMMEDNGLTDKVNVIIVSDHGMAPIPDGTYGTLVDISDEIDMSEVIHITGYGAVQGIHTYSSRGTAMLYNSLKAVIGIDVYRQSDIPEHLQYRHTRNLPDLLLVAKSGFYMNPLSPPVQIPDPNSYPPMFGDHGWRKSEPRVRTIFFALGPDFKKGFKHPFIRLVDEYQIFSLLLGIEPKPNNGSCDRVKDMFAKSSDLSPTSLCSHLSNFVWHYPTGITCFGNTA